MQEPKIVAEVEPEDERARATFTSFKTFLQARSEAEMYIQDSR